MTGLGRNLIEVGDRDKVVELFASNDEVLEILLEAWPDVRITEQAIIRAAETKETSRLILSHRQGSKVPTSQETFSKMVVNNPSLDAVKHVIDVVGPDVPFTEPLFRAAAGEFKVLQYLLQATPEA